jgi:hypothetical protein
MVGPDQCLAPPSCSVREQQVPRPARRLMLRSASAPCKPSFSGAVLPSLAPWAEHPTRFTRGLNPLDLVPHAVYVGHQVRGFSPAKPPRSHRILQL